MGKKKITYKDEYTKEWAEAELMKKKKETINIHSIPEDTKMPDTDKLEVDDELWNAARKKFIGEQFAIALRERGPDDKHICFDIFSEDDGWWCKQGSGSSSFWIDDLIEQLQRAKEHMKKYEYGKEGEGYEFKDR